MTKEQFAEVVRKVCSGGEDNSDLKKRYSDNVINALTTLSYSQVIFSTYKNAAKNNDYSQFNSFLKTYKVDVEYDSDTEEYYCTLPVQIIQLPDDAGIRSITPTKDKSYNFVYSGDGTTYSSQEIRSILTKPVYEVEGNTIRFEKDKFSKQYNELLLKLIPSLEAFDDNEEIGIPAENSFDIFNYIKETMQKMLPVKNTIDDTTKQI